jgi:hypothetical protein
MHASALFLSLHWSISASKRCEHLITWRYLHGQQLKWSAVLSVRSLLQNAWPNRLYLRHTVRLRLRFPRRFRAQTKATKRHVAPHDVSYVERDC